MIGLDFETRGSIDLEEVGSARYSSHPDTSIICLGYEDFDSGEVGLWRPGMDLPRVIVQGATRGREFVAHNAGFDRRIWANKFRKVPLPGLDRWHCSAVRCSVNGLPRNLDDACLALFGEYAKDKTEADALKKMMKPQRGVWLDTPELRGLVESRCSKDVTFMGDLIRKTKPLSEFEREWWLFDQECNDRGIPIDLASVENISGKLEMLYAHVQRRIWEGTDYQVESTTKLKKFGEWLSSRGIDLPNLRADTIAEVIRTMPGADPQALHALDLKRVYGLAAPKKFAALARRAEPDDILDGYGTLRDAYIANGAHTGRDTSKGFQTQNLKRETADLADMLGLLEAKTPEDLDLLSMLGEEPLETTGKSIRLMVKAHPGHKLLIGDFSKIETVVLLWIAEARSALEKIRNGVDLYLDLASTIFREKVTKAQPEKRQLGKHGILGCGFGVGLNGERFQQMVFELSGMRIDLEMAKRVVRTYRDSIPEVPRYWYALEGAVRKAIVEKTAVKLGRLNIACNGEVLGIQLPSGRLLRYRSPTVHSDGRITFWGVRSKTKTYGINDTWGGTLTENVVQAIANDLLREAAIRLTKAGYSIIMRSHDELVSHEFDKNLDEFTRIMELKDDVKWWDGMPISVESKECERYSK